MGLLRSLLQQCKKPQGILGRMVLSAMNSEHAPIAGWTLKTISWNDGARILDVGCGGGANILRMLSLYPSSHVDGVDYSETSVEKSKTTLRKCDAARYEIKQGDVMRLPYADESYDAVTAFETIYFWPDIAEACREVKRVLKTGGKFVIGCELSDSAKWAMITKRCENMTLYSAAQLKEIVGAAGFHDVAVHEKGEWCCIEGLK